MFLWFLMLGLGSLIGGLAYRAELISRRQPRWFHKNANSLMVPFWRANRFGQPGEVTDPRLWRDVTRRTAVLCAAFGVVYLLVALMLAIWRFEEPSGQTRFILFVAITALTQGIIWWYAARTAAELAQQIVQNEP